MKSRSVVPRHEGKPSKVCNLARHCGLFASKKFYIVLCSYGGLFDPMITRISFLTAGHLTSATIGLARGVAVLMMKQCFRMGHSLVQR